MGKYLLRRILQMIPVVLGTTLLVYALYSPCRATPSRPCSETSLSMSRRSPDPRRIPSRPAVHRSVLHLPEECTDPELRRVPSPASPFSTKSPALPGHHQARLDAFVFEAIFGVVFGIISGLKKGKWYDTVILIVSLLLISVPTFVTGFVMQYVFGIQWAILPVTAGADPGFLDLLMPAMVLGSVSMAYIIRLTRSEISSNIAEDYVRTARAKGMSNGQVMLRHVLRNSLIPVVTYLGQDIGA